MIYHIPFGTTVWRTKSTSNDPKYTEAIVTNKEIYYTDGDLIGISSEPVVSGSLAIAGSPWGCAVMGPPINQTVYKFLLPLSAKPWWSFHVFESAIHRIEFIGPGTSDAKSEKELLQDLNSGKIDPFKTTPESQTDGNATAEERIVGRALSPRERATIREQWDKEDEELVGRLCKSINAVTDSDVILEMTEKPTAAPTGIPQRFLSNPTGPNWAKDDWMRSLMRPIFPLLPKDLLPKMEKPTDPAEAIAWAIDREILNKLTNGLHTLGELTPSGRIFYLDYKF